MSGASEAVGDGCITVLDARQNPVILTLGDDYLEIKNSGKIFGSSTIHKIPYYNIVLLTVGDIEHFPVLDKIQNKKEGPSVRFSLKHVADPDKNNYKIVELKWNIFEGTDRPSLMKFAGRLYNSIYPPPVKFMKRAKVLVNPHSGPGKGVTIWTEVVKPMFDAAKITCDVTKLLRGGQATELVQSMQMGATDMIVSVSGDGTPHEIFNGLAKGELAGANLKCPVAHIPAGSGNALALNLYGSNKPGAAALAIIKGHVTAMDLVSITQGEKRYFSFLSQALGIIADSDLGTEHWRWMGARRFELGLAIRVFQKKCYPCDLAIKVVQDTKEGVKQHYKQYVEGTQGSLPMSQELPPLKYGTVLDDLPEDWELVPDEHLGNFYCGNMAYMAPDASFFPAALPADGCMDLVRIDGTLSAAKATKTLLAVESGNFFNLEHVRYQKVEAYRIIPREQNGYVSIDGEMVPFQPFQAEIHQGLCRVMSKAPGKFQAAGPVGWDGLEKPEERNT